MTDDQSDSESAINGTEEEGSETPKKTFGILAARFLQKGKSSPGSITGEFEALTPPASTPTPEVKVRNLHPIDDEDEDIREGSIHGMEVPLNESLYADIGLDDMNAFGDADADAGEFAANYAETHAMDSAPEVVYDIDAGERPVISYAGSNDDSEEIQHSRAEYAPEPVEEIDAVQAPAYGEPQEPEYAASAEISEVTPYTAEPEYATESQSQEVFSEESVKSQPYEAATEHSMESQPYEAAPDYSVESQPYEAAPEYSVESQSYEAAPEYSVEPQPYEAAQDEASPAYEVNPPSYEAPPEYEGNSQSYEAASDFAIDSQPTSDYQPNLASEGSGVDEAYQAPAYDVSALNSIGVKSDSSTFDKNVLDQIGTGTGAGAAAVPEAPATQVPEKKGLLGKFTGKKDAPTRPQLGGSKAETKSPEPSELDKIGTKGAGFDASELDKIGSKSTGFDASDLDKIGTKSTGFDASDLDKIGTKSTGFDASQLDKIGTKSWEAAALDQIPEPKPGTEEKPAKGGLLGGKFGQKAKGLDKPKLGGAIVPPSADPSFDQKETGRFLVNQTDAAESFSGESNLTSPDESYAPSEDFSATIPEPQPEMFSPAPEALSASFFDDSSAVVEEQEHIPVIPSDEVGRLITDADNAFRMRQYKAAEPIFASVLDKLDKAGDENDPLLPYCLDKMADNLYELKKFNEALGHYRRLLVLQTKLSVADRDMIATLYKIAQTSEALNLTSEADSMYKRAFRLGQQSLVPGDPLLAKVLEGYGTMLMRSENAEAGGADAADEDAGVPGAGGDTTSGAAAEARAAERASALSAEEIKMLNALGADKPASEPSPIILSGGPTEPTAAKARTPLRESDERADKVRSSVVGPSAGSGAGGVWVRLGVFLTVIAALILGTLNIKTDYSSHNVPHSKDFQRKVYKTADGQSTFTIVSEDEASKDNFGKHFAYQYRDWNGTPSDDLEVIGGQITGDNFIYIVPQGIKDGAGFVFYDKEAPEMTTVAKMRELGSKAQAIYKSKGKYPESKELEGLGKSLNYKNPFNEGADAVTTNSIAWPPNLDATQIYIKSRFDTNLEDGGQWEGEAPAKPGQVSAVSSSQKQPDASVLYIHGRDRSGNLLTRADGKVLVLIYKNGIEVTPAAADLRNEKPLPGPAPLRISKTNGGINAASVVLSYVPIVFFVILSFIFLAMANKGTDRSKGFPLALFGVIWAPVMVLLTGLTKFVPAAYSTYCLIASLLVFFGGLGWLGFQTLKNKPKKPKKPPAEASAM